MLKKIVIIQNHPTQFDVPLFSYISNKKLFKLVIFYTETNYGGGSGVDSEISIAPQWDHTTDLIYEHYFRRSTFKIWREIVQLNPIHIIICGWYPRSHAFLAILLRISGFSIGIRSDNTLMHTKLTSFHGLVKRFIMAFWLGIYNVWHPVGSLSSDYLNKLSFLKRDSIYFPYSIDVDWFEGNNKSINTKRIELRNNLGISPDNFIILGVMKWSDREDPITLVNAFIRAYQSNHNIRLLLVGDGPLRNKIMDLISQAPNLFIAPGYVKYSELPMYYSISDLFVHPAKSEPYGVSIQEAMACGLPVLASSMVGAASDFIVPGVNGDIFPVGDVNSLANYINMYASKVDDHFSRDVSILKSEEWSYINTIKKWNKWLG